MTLEPLGDSALVLTTGAEVDAAGVTRAVELAEGLRHSRLPGVLEVVPAFATVTVFFDVSAIGDYAAFEARLRAVAEKAADGLVRPAPPRELDVPVCYGGEYGPDLEEVAARAGLGLDDVIRAHAAAEYRVQAVGFVPGFAYLGGLPKRLHTPRRPTPRPKVAPGSVGIGGALTGVYPVEIPGGWNLIGRTPLRMFDLGRSHPALLRSGDRVRFRAVTPEEFRAWR